MFGTDLPPGDWSATLIGGYWPSHGALDLLATAAAGRRRGETQFHDYADHLRSISREQLAAQDGIAADAARSLFARGEDRARATAERNAAKRRSYESARQRVTALRDDLAQLASDGNATIRQIQQSPAPLAEKVSSIVAVITDTQTLARTKTAESAGNLLTDVQQVLDAQGADVSARAFATTHGIEPTPPRVAAAEALTHHVTARLESSGFSAGPGGETAPGTGGPGSAAPAGWERAGDSDLAGQVPATGELANSVAALTAGAGLLAAAGLTGGATAEASAAGNADVPTSRAGPSPQPVPVTAAAAPSPASAPAPRSGIRPAIPGLPAAPPGTPSSPAALATPARPGGTAAPHQTGATTTSGTAGLIRRTVPAVPTAVGAERALAGAPAPSRSDRLEVVLALVAGQEPRLRWAVGDDAHGGVVLATDVAGGWIPPGVRVPDGVRLLPPGIRTGAPADLLSECTPIVTYEPGQYLPPQSNGMTTSVAAREVAPVTDLGWQLASATMWREGLPRLAHTLARAATTGSGWLESEAALLRQHLVAAADRALAGYPEIIDGADIGNWQLLATIDGLVSADPVASSYHFAWFTAGVPAPRCWR